MASSAVMMRRHFGSAVLGFRWKISSILSSRVSVFGSRSIVITSKSVNEALSCIKSKLDSHRKTQLFIGTGQYYTHETNERIFALSLGKTDQLATPLQLLDTGIPTADIQILEKEMLKLPSCSELLSGEVDSVNEEPWSFGFSKSPFSIFSKTGYCLTSMTTLRAGPAFRVYNGPLFEEIYMKNIQNIQVSLSEEPWEERKMELKQKGGEILTVVEDFKSGGSLDLLELMMTTEWMVKAAGHLCLAARLIGGQKDIVLKLPDPLRAENNPWIEMRNKTWIEKVHNNNDA